MLPSLSRFLCVFAVLSGLLSGCTTTPATLDHIEAPPDETASEQRLVAERFITLHERISPKLFHRADQRGGTLEPADPYMTMVGYFNSLRELGGMRRLAEDDVQTRSYRVQMSMVERPALAQRSVNNIRELTSRVSSQDIPKYLDDLEIKFKAAFDAAAGKYLTKWSEGDKR